MISRTYFSRRHRVPKNDNNTFIPLLNFNWKTCNRTLSFCFFKKTAKRNIFKSALPEESKRNAITRMQINATTRIKKRSFYIAEKVKQVYLFKARSRREGGKIHTTERNQRKEEKERLCNMVFPVINDTVYRKLKKT